MPDLNDFYAFKSTSSGGSGGGGDEDGCLGKIISLFLIFIFLLLLGQCGN